MSIYFEFQKNLQVATFKLLQNIEKIFSLTDTHLDENTMRLHTYSFVFFIFSLLFIFQSTTTKDANNKSSPDSGYPNDDSNMPEKGFYENLPFHGIHSANKNVSKNSCFSSISYLCDES